MDVAPIVDAATAARFRVFAARSPHRTHRRAAACGEVGCAAYEFGWVTMVNEGGDLGAAQAAYIRHRSGRRYTEEPTEDGLTRFTFEAGQACFRGHTVPLGRPPLYVVQDGAQARLLPHAEAFVNESGTALDAVAALR